MGKFRIASFLYVGDDCIYQTQNIEYKSWGTLINITTNIITFQVYWMRG